MPKPRKQAPTHAQARKVTADRQNGDYEVPVLKEPIGGPISGSASDAKPTVDGQATAEPNR